MNHFDCVVIGGGMVGAASALSLAELGLKIAVVEQKAPTEYTPEQAFDLRVSAISLASEQLLTQLGAWAQLTQWRQCSYKRLGVWELEHAYTEFNAADIQQSHLGHIIENRLIQLSIWQQLVAHPNVTLMCPESLQSFQHREDKLTIMLSTTTISANIIIGADGANSQVRKMAGIGITGWDYLQSAMLVNVQTAMSQQDITWQQFSPTGPVAMLPMPGNNASLVWYHHRDEIKRLSQLSNAQLQVEIHRHFPEKLGEIKVTNKAAFPLTRRHANQYVSNKVVLIGDAAHTINPMAGQGVNLGFKDVKALQTTMAMAIGDGESWCSPAVLERYEQARRNDNLLMMSTMDALYMTFGHVSPLVRFGRNFGLKVVNKLPALKNKALAYACGI